jgi:DNA-binding CsgD family transcriptional regulator
MAPRSSAELDELARSAVSELRAGAPPRFLLELRERIDALGDGLTDAHAGALLVLAEVESARSALPEAEAHFSRLTGLGGASPEVRVRARAGHALVAVRQGEWQRAERFAADAVELAEQLGLTQERRTAIAVAAIVPASRGELPTALARMEEAERADDSDARNAEGNADPAPDPLRDAALLRARICLAIGLNDWALLQRTLQAADATGVPVHLTRSEWLGLQVLAAWHRGQRAHADELMAGWSRGSEVTADPYFFAFSSVLHSRDRRIVDELDSIRHALELLGPGEDPLGRAWIRIVAGTAISRHGGPDGLVEGLAVYKEARAELAALGASIFVARCDSIIASTSGAVTESLRSDPTRALSQQQRRVAALVAQGFTSSEIAAQITVSRKTVDFHVANVLARLGLSNRREIGRALRESLGDAD